MKTNFYTSVDTTAIDPDWTFMVIPTYYHVIITHFQNGQNWVQKHMLLLDYHIVAKKAEFSLNNYISRLTSKTLDSATELLNISSYICPTTDVNRMQPLQAAKHATLTTV